ncbi:MAG: ABC transporter substrate-binding protein [Thermoplasmata archaeon]
MNKTKTFHIKKLIILKLILTLFGCSLENKGQKSCSQDIVFQLNWINDPTFTGEYLAFEKFWPSQKLNVKVLQGGLGIDPIAMVVSKKADYAVVGADKALMAISNGSPLKIISVDLQRNPVGWIARAGLKVLNFKDMEGREDIIIGDKAGSEISSILQLIIHRKRLKIKPKSVSYDFSYFISNENVIYPVYLNEEPIRARVVNKIDIIEIDPIKEENGSIKLYGNVIIAHADKLIQCKNQVDAIIDGLVKGWLFAKNNIDEATQIVNKYVKGDEEYVRGVVIKTVDFATNLYGHEVPPGHMEITAWENTYNTLKEANLILNDIDLRAVLYIR